MQWLWMISDYQVHVLFQTTMIEKGTTIKHKVFPWGLTAFALTLCDVYSMNTLTSGTAISARALAPVPPCLSQSPLLIGCDVRTMSAEIRDLLANKEVIAVNQGQSFHLVSSHVLP